LPTAAGQLSGVRAKPAPKHKGEKLCRTEPVAMTECEGVITLMGADPNAGDAVGCVGVHRPVHVNTNGSRRDAYRVVVSRAVDDDLPASRVIRSNENRRIVFVEWSSCRFGS